MTKFTTKKKKSMYKSLKKKRVKNTLWQLGGERKRRKGGIKEKGETLGSCKNKEKHKRTQSPPYPMKAPPKPKKVP